MKKMLSATAIVLASTCFAESVWAQAGTTTASTSTGVPTVVKPGDLKWADAGNLPPGAKLAVIEGAMNEAGPITARIKLPANYKLPAHGHPGIERITVLTGSFNYGTGDKLDPQKTTGLGIGSAIIIPPKLNYFAWTTEETIVQLNVTGPWGITYVDPTDDPRKK